MTPQPAITITTLFITLTLFACTSIDRGSFGEFTRSLNTTDYGYKVGKDPTHDAPTELIEVFQVNPGDCGESTGWSDCANDRERSELSEKVKDNYPGSEHWYGWSIYFPNDFPNVFPTKTALGQFHQDKSHPVWLFQNADGGYHLDDQVRGTTRRYYSLIDEVDLRGQWHKIEVHVRWEKNDNGFFKVWVNGDNKVDYRGQTMDADRVYFKYGVYRTFLSRFKNKYDQDAVPSQVAYFSNVKRANSRSELSPLIGEF